MSVFAPLAWNLLPAGTVLTAAAAFERGSPASNLWTSDLDRPAVWRGQFVEPATPGKVDFDEGAGALVATLTTGTYRSPAEWIAHVAARMRAAGTLAYRGHWLQGSADRHRFRLTVPSGTFSLAIQSGPNTAVNALKLRGGFRDADRAAAATHTGDLACCQGERDVLEVDLGATKSARLTAILRPRLSPAAAVSVAIGDTSPPTTTVVGLGDAPDDEVLAVRHSPAVRGRYFELRLSDIRRTIGGARPSAGLLFHGPALDSEDVTEDAGATGHDWKVTRTLMRRGTVREGKAGHAHLSEQPPRETLALTLGGGEVLHPGTLAAWEEAVHALGVSAYAILMLDPVNEPNRDTFLVRPTAAPSMSHVYRESSSGRWTLPLQLERVL